MKKDVSLSIIIPVYNVKEYLKDCLDSVFSQRYDDYEVIIVDDGSTDGSGKLCDQLAVGKENCFVIHSENQGLAKARNLGIKHSHGKYLGFVDSDDMIHPQMYDLLMNEAVITDADTVSCCYHTFSDNSEIFISIINTDSITFDRMKSKEFITDFWNRAFLRIGVPQWCGIYKSSMFKRFGVNTDYRYYEDLNTLPDILENSSRISYSETKLYYYRLSDNSIIRSPMNQDKIDKLGSWKNRIIPFLEKNCDKETIKRGYETYIERYGTIVTALCQEKRKDLIIPKEYHRYLLLLIYKTGRLRFKLKKESIYNALYYFFLISNYRIWFWFINRKI